MNTSKKQIFLVIGFNIGMGQHFYLSFDTVEGAKEKVKSLSQREGIVVGWQQIDLNESEDD
jgi:hypothetical protein